MGLFPRAAAGRRRHPPRAGALDRPMAQRIVKMPDIGEGTTEAEIVSWLVKVGDIVTEEDPLAEVMTDKATVEIPTPVAGKVIALHGKPGEKLAVGSDLVVLEVAGTETPAPPRPAAAPPPSPPPALASPAPSREGRNGTPASAEKPLSRTAAAVGAETKAKVPGEERESSAPSPRPS